MSSIDKLTELFRKFPGVGPRQAKRFVYHLLTRRDGTIEQMVNYISHLEEEISVCSKCCRFFSTTASGIKPTAGNQPVCSICSNPNRDTSVLMIVPRDVDLENMERSRAFNGLYFVLGGSVPILEENPGSFIRQNELSARFAEMLDHDLKEVIIAVNANPEGEHTTLYVNAVLKSVSDKSGKPVRFTTLGRGLSTGTELEYSDAETIKSALENRR